MKLTSNIYLGLMSGTSLDGLDIVAVTFSFDQKTPYSIMKGVTYDYPEHLEKGLSKCRVLNGLELSKLENELSYFSADKINAFIDDLGIDKSDICAIGHHGHTVFHQPEQYFTKQILNGSIVAAKTGIVTVCDFRSQDVALGGQGAPLVPIGDRDLFIEYDGCMNLGGIANISIKNGEGIKAFDVCPFNLVLNHYAQKLGKAYDHNGMFSSQGTPIETIKQKLNRLSYYRTVPPKSLGIEWVENEFFSLLQPLENTHSIKDLLATAVAHYVEQISVVLKKHEIDKLLVTGGGAFNVDFIKKLKKTNPERQIISPSKDVINYKEAIVFAYLAYLRIQNKINVLSEVTGADSDSCSGAVFMS